MSTEFPDFFIVGAAKSGTTTLFNALNYADDIYLPMVKEPYFFSSPSLIPRGAPWQKERNQYIKLFAPGKEQGKITGEASPAYLYERGVAERIYRANPSAKIIILLRNPVERAYALYWHHRRQHAEPLSFSKAIHSEEKRIEQGWSFGYHYVASGRYLKQIEQYLQVFPETQIKLFLFEDWCEKGLTTVYTESCEFLEIEPGVAPPEQLKSNKGFRYRNERLIRTANADFPGRRSLVRFIPALKTLKQRFTSLQRADVKPLSDPMRRMLKGRFSDEYPGLEELTGRDLRSWR